ncbi:MAG TPA: ATP-binding protein, partial [Planctomycetaceae bacterium]|nr:ATP-binding protein [Planctomycetaceae bacterium]
LRKERIELAPVVYHAVEAARPLIQDMDQELTVTLPPEPVYLDADWTRLAQIVGNLLSNACKFTGRGGRIWLTVEVEDGKVTGDKVTKSGDIAADGSPEGRDGGSSPCHPLTLSPCQFAILRVRDTGVGIAPDQLRRIFDMFVQVDSSLERSVGGLGIGLTLVKSLVELHGGTVEVHSAGIGEGSEFLVRLPIVTETPEPQPPTPAGGEPTAIGEPAAATSRRILVVDDNRDSAESLALLLNLSGHETQTAYDGLETIEAASTFRPDVVLLDIGMPRLNGYEAARRIREQPWGQDMLLVALTGWGQEEDRKKSREAGFDGHLVKPVDYDALGKLLAEVRPGQVE